jgi:hypothetical protein
VDYPLLVCGLERVGNLTCNGQRLVSRDRPARDPLRQVLASDELHNQRCAAAAVLEPVNGGNVGVIRDLPLQLRVGGAIHLAHPAHADPGDATSVEVSLVQISPFSGR